MAGATQRTALVLTSGGARGAYQAGAVAELLPVLAAEGHTPTLLVGESVGGLNVTAMAADAHLPLARRAAGLVARWSQVSRGQVLRSLWRQLPLLALRYGGETLGAPGLRLRGLLGTEPMRRSLDSLIDWERLHRNVARGLVDGVAVAATRVSTGRAVVFVETAAGDVGRGDDAIALHETTLTPDHVLASAAIPVLFPPVRLDEGPDHAGWYVDGATRLHTPLRPALDLGADRLVVVGATSTRRRTVDADGDTDLADAGVALLNAMIEDSLRDDLRRLETVNAHLVGDGPGHAAVRRQRDAVGRPRYRRVPFIAVTPDDPAEIGRVAIEVFAARYRGLRGARDPDFEAMHRLAGGPSPLQGELLSYLLFDRDFHDELIRLGRRDARRWLDARDDPWTLTRDADAVPAAQGGDH